MHKEDVYLPFSNSLYVVHQSLLSPSPFQTFQLASTAAVCRTTASQNTLANLADQQLSEEHFKKKYLNWLKFKKYQHYDLLWIRNNRKGDFFIRARRDQKFDEPLILLKAPPSRQIDVTSKNRFLVKYNIPRVSTTNSNDHAFRIVERGLFLHLHSTKFFFSPFPLDGNRNPRGLGNRGRYLRCRGHRGRYPRGWGHRGLGNRDRDPMMLQTIFYQQQLLFLNIPM